MEQVKVPDLGESVTSAKVTELCVGIESKVDEDDLLAILETDKVSVEIHSPCAGTIKSIACEVGAVLEKDTVMFEIEKGAAASAAKTLKPAGKSVENIESEKKFEASPAAVRVSAAQGVSLQDIEGTGRGGRITKGDVLQTANSTTSTNLTPAIPIDTSARESSIKMSPLRKKIAERLKQSQNEAAILTTFNEINMSRVIEMRARHKDKFLEAHGCKLGFMSFFVKAVIAALKQVPDVNTELRDDCLIYKNYYNIGVAVGTKAGLVVPVLKDADTLSYAEIEKAIADFGKKAQEKSLAVHEMQGGTFTISNGGVYGSLLSTPIINPPQAGILGMHTIQKRPVVSGNDEIKIAPMMYIALSYDHRIIDGRGAVTFLKIVKEQVEDPSLNMLF